MTGFPDIPMFSGINAPCRVEADINDLEVVGEIPAGIDGAFYRVTADHLFPPRFGDTAEMRWFTAPNQFTSHVMNAWNEGTKVCFDTCVAPEGDGRVVQAATNAESMLTEVNLFEATQISRGPIATVKLPLRLKPAYHGNWADSGRVNPVSDGMREEIAA